MIFDWYAAEWRKEEKEKFNCFSKIKFLATNLDFNGNKEKYKLLIYGRKKSKRDSAIVPCYPKFITEMLELMNKCHICKPTIEILKFPSRSFIIQFQFKLASSYISKDDEEFYIIDNPIRKDKVFKVPMVSGSSWKGNLRWTAGKLLELAVDDKKLDMRIQITKLFGNENEAERRYFNSIMKKEKSEIFEKEIKNWTTKDGLRTGRLNFYPTFFDKISLEVINPHDRKTKAGTHPIYIESVPADADGIFSLLYVPFDLMGKPVEKIKEEVKEDLKLICRAIKELMLTYGFSAKKSSGFGIVKDKIDLVDGRDWFDGKEIDIVNKKNIKEISRLEQIIIE